MQAQQQLKQTSSEVTVTTRTKSGRGKISESESATVIELNTGVSLRGMSNNRQRTVSHEQAVLEAIQRTG